MRLKRRSSSRRASSSSRRGDWQGREGGQGGGEGGEGEGGGGRRAASTPLRAGSASSMKNKMRGPPSALRALSRAFFGGCKRREKGRFHLGLIQHAARSADSL